MNELTREQILAMPAGRELDKAVAEHLKMEFWDHYSSDIAAAWEAEEKIKELSGGEKELIIRYMTILMHVVGDDGFDMLHATPEQRCKAALLAVMGL